MLLPDGTYEFKNVSGSVVPARGIIDAIDVQVPTPGRVVIQGNQPAIMGCQYNGFITGPVDVQPNQYGSCRRLPVMECLYDALDGTPANGQVWGPLGGTFKLKKNCGGFYCIGAPTNTNRSTALFTPQPMTMVVGYTSTIVFAGSFATFNVGAGTVSAFIHDGLVFGLVEYQLVFDTIDNSFDVANPVLAGDGICYAGCAKGASATVNIFQEDTIGDELDSGFTLQAFNRWATVAPGNQVRWEWNNDSGKFEMTAQECGTAGSNSSSSRAGEIRVLR